MKARLLLCAVLLLFSRAAWTEDLSFTGLVTGDRVHMRAGPGQSYEILHTLNKRDRLWVLAREGDWYGVRLPEHILLYVHHSLVESAGEEGRILGERVQVRSGPGVHFVRMAVLSRGDRVVVARPGGEWVAIRPPGSCRGWVRRDYVTFLEPAPPATGGS